MYKLPKNIKSASVNFNYQSVYVLYNGIHYLKEPGSYEEHFLTTFEIKPVPAVHAPMVFKLLELVNMEASKKLKITTASCSKFLKLCEKSCSYFFSYALEAVRANLNH